MKTSTLTVYFSGTAHGLNDYDHLASVLNYGTTTDDDGSLRKAFNGCGLTNGLMGNLFGTGLEAQCDEVLELVQLQLRMGRRVRVNAYGHSRGGVAALMLAKRLGQYSEDIVETNLCLMDPVPGNFIWTSTIDFTHRTLARQTMNLKECHNLKKVLVLYPNEPLPNIFAHAPLLCDYPEHCDVDEEIMPGCHAGAQFVSEMNITTYRKIAFLRCYQFLKNCGTTFSSVLLSRFTHSHINADDQGELLSAYEKEFKCAKSADETKRSCHVKRGTAILARPQAANCLSAQHAALYARSNPDVEPIPCIPLYSFSRARPQHTAKPANAMNALDIESLFNGAATSMMLGNQADRKGTCVKQLLAVSNTVTHETSHHYLRNGIAILLQRDNQWCGLFSRTTSGKALLNLLNTYPQYAAIKQTILGAQQDRPLRYDDLRCYVLGRNDKAFFAQKNAGTLFAEFQNEEDFLKNQPQYFLPR